MNTQLSAGLAVRIGVFFDGTANNQHNAELGATRRAAGQFVVSGSSYSNDVSNIARLQRLYRHELAADKQGCASFSVYIEGVGTTCGKFDAPAGLILGRGRTGLLAKVQKALVEVRNALVAVQKANPGRPLRKLGIDLFGFSRGAAAARHFANELRRGSGGWPGTAGIAWAPGFSWQLKVIGLFDTVAALGGLKDWGDLSDNANHGIDLYLPEGCADQVIHLIARDERRRNFSLNQVLPEWQQEIALPGAHADIGGGYRVEEQEQLFLTQPDAQWLAPDSTLMDTQAWQQTSGWAAQAVDYGWLDPEDPQRLLEVRSWVIGRMRRDETRQRVMVAVFMQRRVLGHLSRVYLRLMHSLAVEAGVPFDPVPSNAELALPEELQAIELKLQAFARDGVTRLSDAEERLLRHRYIHCSGHWNPAVGSGDGASSWVFTNAPREQGRQCYPQSGGAAY